MHSMKPMVDIVCLTPVILELIEASKHQVKRHVFGLHFKSQFLISMNKEARLNKFKMVCQLDFIGN